MRPILRDAGCLLFPDTFTNYYEPEIGAAAIDVVQIGLGARSRSDRPACAVAAGR